MTDASVSARPRVMQPGQDQLRLLSKVARMYHERGIRQPQIASELSISQARVSRLLRQAAKLGIVRTVVTTPTGTYTDLEEQIQLRYGLRDVVVVDTTGSGGDLGPALGAAAADYLDVTLTGGDRIGVSSWSATLVDTVDVMRSKAPAVAEYVVQLLGGLGDSAVQMTATHLTAQLAQVTGGTPAFLPAPGLVSNASGQRTLMQDPTINAVSQMWSTLTLALVGIGSLEPSPLIASSGNVLAEKELDEMRALGAVGDICLRFFDATGATIASDLDRRLIGITAAGFRSIPRRVGVAGGERKSVAVRAALLGGWINVLITDLGVAKRLVSEPRQRTGGSEQNS